MREWVRFTALECGVRGHRVFADRFVELLTVAAVPRRLHQYGFAAGERSVGAQVLGDLALVDAQSLNDLARKREDLVGAQDRFGQDRAPVGTVVERALEEIRRRVLPRNIGIAGQQSRERTDAFRHHRIALERHRRTADLLRAERFEHLTEAGRTLNAHVGGEL